MLHSTNPLLVAQLGEIIRQSLPDAAVAWLEEKSKLVAEEKQGDQLNLTFVMVPRKTGRNVIAITDGQKHNLRQVHPQYQVDDWTIDRLCRVWILLHVNAFDVESYCRKLESLKAAEMNELVALYTALPLLQYPEYWQRQCAEGIRSNIDDVLKAIMYNNPYPYQYLPEPAWNQLVMKAFFTDKDIHRIIGIDERSNQELARILVDYANERWSAHRVVNPQLWRLVAPFIDERNFAAIQKAFQSAVLTERKAAALACYNSGYEPAKQLLEQEPELKTAILENRLNWRSL